MESDNFKIISVDRNLISIEILDPGEFDNHFNIGSFIKIPHDKSSTEEYIVGVIENYKIKANDDSDPESANTPASFIIEVRLIGTYIKIGTTGKYVFNRGAHGVPLPPNNGIAVFEKSDFENIFSCRLEPSEQFTFSRLAENLDIPVPINGNKFFNKHFAIVGSTGSGKSHTLAKIIQQAVKEKDGGFKGLNNSHIVIFDIHGEYKKAFPDGRHINHTNIKIPYWLFDSEELADLFIESNEDNSHNQVSVFKHAVRENKVKHNKHIDADKIYFDSPVVFDIREVINYIKNVNNEVVGKCAGENLPKLSNGTLVKDRKDHYFDCELEFCEASQAAATRASAGPYKGDFERFILRLENTVNNPRLRFIFDTQEAVTLQSVMEHLLGFGVKTSNVTVVDVSGIPFEVLSSTVSLISRILFDYGYYHKRSLPTGVDCEVPLLIVYEEAHKYVPQSNLVKYRASKNAIERIAKEGRKYGVTLGIVSQRPSEVSETIFSQCNNFIAMRLTNPDDQNYVKKLLPDAIGDITSSLPSLQSGEALIIGESIALPSVVKIDLPDYEPESTDIRYLDLWKKAWKDVDFKKLSDMSSGIYNEDKKS